MNKVGRSSAFEGGGGYYPDLSGQQRANLSHIERNLGKIGRQPTFKEVSGALVDRIGPVPAFALMLPFAVGGLLDLDSQGVQVGHGSDFSLLSVAAHGLSEHVHIDDLGGGGGGEVLLQQPKVNFFFGDNIAMIGNDNVGVAGVAPAVNLFEGQNILSGHVLLENLQDKEVLNDATTRYTLVVNTPELWKQIRLLALQPGRRNNSKVTLQNLEKVDGYGGVGNIFIDVTRDFSNNNWKVRIWGHSGEKKEIGDGVFEIPELELGVKQLKRMPVFSVGENVKNAMLVPVDAMGGQIVVELPFLEGMKKSWTDEEGFWRAYDGEGKEWILENGAWVEVDDTLAGGLKLEVGKADENGNAIIEKFIPPDGLDAEDLERWVEQWDETRLGLEGDWVQTEDGRVVLLDELSDPESVLAEYRMFEQTETMQVVWDWNKIQEGVLSVGKKWSANYGWPIDNSGYFDSIRELRKNNHQPLLDRFGKTGKGRDGNIAIDGGKGVFGYYIEFLANADNEIPAEWHLTADEVVFLFAADPNGDGVVDEEVVIFVENMKWTSFKM